jgi:hypothetical protein
MALARPRRMIVAGFAAADYLNFSSSAGIDCKSKMKVGRRDDWALDNV